MTNIWACQSIGFLAITNGLEKQHEICAHLLEAAIEEPQAQR